MTDPSSRPSGQFPTTAWEQLRDAQERNHFLARYWKPVFVFLRAKGRSPQAAEELTQEFFLRLLEKDRLRQADPTRGKFRTYLLTILVRFLADQTPQRMPRQKAFEQQLTSLEGLIGDEDRAWQPPTNETPEILFMRQWARDLLKDVDRRLKNLCAQKGWAAWYDVCEARAGTGGKPPTQQQLAERFGLTRDEVRSALDKVPQWCQVLLRAEVRRHVGSEDEVDDEVRDILELLGE